MTQEPVKKLELVEAIEGQVKGMDEWMEATERVETMTMGEIVSFIYSGIPGGVKELEAFQNKIRELTKKEYEMFANRMHDEKKTAGDVVLTLHHMLSFAMAKLIKKGLVQEPEEMRRILHRVKFLSALAEIEGFMTSVEKQSEKDGE